MKCSLVASLALMGGSFAGPLPNMVARQDTTVADVVPTTETAEVVPTDMILAETPTTPTDAVPTTTATDAVPTTTAVEGASTTAIEVTPTTTAEGLPIDTGAVSPVNSAEVTPAPTPADAATGCSLVSAPLTTFTYTFQEDADNIGTSLMTFEPTMSCACADGIGAALRTSIDPKGLHSVYCATATGTDLGAAIGTVVPTGTPGDTDNAAWMDIACDYGSLELPEAQAAPEERWKDAGANAAWDSLVEQWYIDNQPANFSNYAADFFHYKENPNCQVIGGGNCVETTQCGSYKFPNAPVNSPAGMCIMNSMTVLHSVFESSYGAMLEGQVDTDAMIGKIVEGFAPIMDEIKDQQRLKIALDAALGAITFVVAPALHSGLSRFAWFKNGANGNVFGTTVDSIYGSMGAIMAGVKDGMEQLSPLPVQNEVANMAKDIVNRWQAGVVDATAKMFGNPENLWGMIHDGQFYRQGDVLSVNPDSASLAISKGLTATLLPMVWMSGDDPKWPVIIVPDGIGEGCDVDLNSWKDSGSHSFDDDVASTGKICGPDGSAYWIGGAHREDIPSRGAHSTAYWKLHVGTPGKVDALNGQDFGGLTKEELVMNAVNGYRANGNTNNWEIPDLTDPKYMETLSTGDLSKSWGLVKIPVCSMNEIKETLQMDGSNDEGNANYPCPA